jgi:type VI secretion system secreted protein VgrG
LGVASTYAVIGASAVTNTGSSVLTGDLGIYPNNASSITGFPPGTYSGTENAGNAAAAAAQAAAQATYTTMNAMTATAISSTLDGQTLAPGVYKESSGHFNLAASGAGTLTLNGAGTYIFQCSSTLTTGAGGVPTITLSGGAKASNVYWIVGSSATINAGSAGTFQGNIIAQASVTDTLGGTVNGTMVALTGAVTMSAATTAKAQPASGADVIASAPYLLGGVEPALNQYVYAGLI